MTVSSTLNTLSRATRRSATANISTIGKDMASGRKGVTNLTAAQIAISSSKSKIVHLDRGYSASAQNGINQIQRAISSLNTIEGYLNSALDLALSSVSGAWSNADRTAQLVPQLTQLETATLNVYNQTLNDSGTVNLLGGLANNIPVSATANISTALLFTLLPGVTGGVAAVGGGGAGKEGSLAVGTGVAAGATLATAMVNAGNVPLFYQTALQGAAPNDIAVQIAIDTTANAALAVAGLQNNLATIAAAKAKFNNIIQQFEAVISSYDDDIEMSTEAYNDITETDMAESASKMQKEMAAIDVAGFVDAAANKLKQAQINTAQRIMAGG